MPISTVQFIKLFPTSVPNQPIEELWLSDVFKGQRR